MSSLLGESQRLRLKYPNRIPVIFEPMDDKVPKLDKNKFLTPYDVVMSSLIDIVRNRLNMNKSQALFFFIKIGAKVMIPNGDLLVLSIYEIYKGVDGFLRIYYGSENTYGSSIEIFS
jgi:hypothetical protein